MVCVAWVDEIWGEGSGGRLTVAGCCLTMLRGLSKNFRLSSKIADPPLRDHRSVHRKSKGHYCYTEPLFDTGLPCHRATRKLAVRLHLYGAR